MKLSAQIEEAHAQKFKCRECGQPSNKHIPCPMLTQALWDTIRKPELKPDIVCFDCAENLLGHKIVFSDLSNCGMTRMFEKLLENIKCV